LEPVLNHVAVESEVVELFFLLSVGVWGTDQRERNEWDQKTSHKMPAWIVMEGVTSFSKPKVWDGDLIAVTLVS
jgi:hypothetical protein